MKKIFLGLYFLTIPYGAYAHDPEGWGVLAISLLGFIIGMPIVSGITAVIISYISFKTVIVKGEKNENYFFSLFLYSLFIGYMGIIIGYLIFELWRINNIQFVFWILFSIGGSLIGLRVIKKKGIRKR